MHYRRLRVGLLLIATMAGGAFPLWSQSLEGSDPRASSAVEVIESSSISPAETPKDPNGRVLGIIPDNRIVPGAAPTIERLTTRGKFELAFKDSIDPFTFASAGFYAGIAQWHNDNPDFGLGMAGYARRFGASYGDIVVGNYFSEAIVPALLRQDPRYFRQGAGGGWSRLKYALSRTVVTRTDSGTRAFNYSEILGNGAAAGISALYYPASDRSIGEVGEKFGVQVAGDAFFNVLIEFWPDMRCRFLHKEH